MRLSRLFAQELGQAPPGVQPRRRKEAQHRLAAVGRRFDRLLPALAGHDTAIRVDLDENVVETLFPQPVAQSDRRGVVRGGMADE
jgi:hypothetical protein